MERLIEGIPGERAAVWVQDRGGGPLRLREEIVIEDLSPVLTSLAASSGANGPLNPVTQYMLARTADHLAERLLDFEALTLPAQGLVIGHALAATAGTMTLGEYLEAAARRAAISDLTEGTPRYSRRFAHLIARDALELTEAFGVDQ